MVIKINEEQLKEIIKETIHKIPFPTIESNYSEAHQFDFLKNRRYICEGLVTTYPHDTVIRQLKRCDLVPDNAIQTLQQENDGEIINIIIVYLPIQYGKAQIARIKGIMNSCGYALSKNPYNVERKNGMYAYAFEPKFSKDITNEVRKQYDYLYHLIKGKSLKKIFQIGLIPRGNDELGIDGLQNPRLQTNNNQGLTKKCNISISRQSISTKGAW